MRERRPGGAGSAGPRMVGAVLAVLGLGTGIAAAVVTQVADSWGYAAYDPVPLNIAVAVTFSAMGLLVVWRRSGNVLGWTMLGIAAWAGVGVLLTTLVGAFPSPTHPAVPVIAGIQIWFWAPPIWAITTLVPMIYPDGRLPDRRWWAAIALTTVGLVVYEVGLALTEEDFAARYTVPNPLASPQGQELARLCLTAGEYLLLGATIVAVAGLVLRWLHATGVRRRRMSLLLLALLFGAVQAVVRDTLPGRLPLVLDRGLEVLAFVLVPLAIAVAMTRERLFDLDVTVRRAVVGVAAAAALVAVYVAGFALVPSSVLPAGVVGALLFPVALLVTRRVARFIRGARVDVVEVAERLGNRIRNQLANAEVPGAVCEQLVRSLRLRMARLELDTDTGLRRLAQVGAPERAERAEQATFELWYRGQRVGRLLVLPPEGQSYVDDMQARALASLADQVAPVVAALRLDEELLRSREQLVTAREEERSRLSRELHDNVGPTLAGIRLQVEWARSALPEDIAGEALDRAINGIDEALLVVRRVVHGLRPPELDALGLSGALRELAMFLSGPSLKVETTLPPDLTVLSKPVEVAAYRIVAEALTNVVRHAQATRAEVTVEIDGPHLVVEVSDDGVGVARVGVAQDGSREGMGLRFMAQRAREIAGEFSYRSGDTGTAVRAVLPLVGRV
jgi:two-component system, NarL family, sensor kinase